MLELKLPSELSHLLHIFRMLLMQSDNFNLISWWIIDFVWYSLLHYHVVDELVGQLIENLQCQLSHAHILEIIILN